MWKKFSRRIKENMISFRGLTFLKRMEVTFFSLRVRWPAIRGRHSRPPFQQFLTRIIFVQNAFQETKAILLLPLHHRDSLFKLLFSFHLNPQYKMTPLYSFYHIETSVFHMTRNHYSTLHF